MQNENFYFYPPLFSSSGEIFFYSLLRSEAVGGGKVFFASVILPSIPVGHWLCLAYMRRRRRRMPINFPIPLLPSSLSFSPITRIGKRRRRPKEACIISEEGGRGREGAGKVCESRVGERGHKRFIRMLSASVCLNNPWPLHFLTLLWQQFRPSFRSVCQGVKFKKKI